MALTNAERQRRYRQKLKSRASGEAAGEVVRNLVDRTIEALWSARARGGTSRLAATVPDTLSLDEFRGYLARQPDALLTACRTCLTEPDTIAPDEHRLIASVVDVAAALNLAPGHGQGLAQERVAPPKAVPVLVASQG